MTSRSFLTAPANRLIERQRCSSLVAGNSSVIQAQQYQLSIEILFKFHHFIENCNTQTLLLKMNDDKRAKKLLIDDIEKNDIPTASSLILSGSVNLNDELFPLHRAAQHGRVEIMTLLLDAGADINAADVHQRTACHVAISNKHFDSFKLLVERGANLGVVPSLLSTARYVIDERFVILLLDAGALLNDPSLYNLIALVKSVAVFNRLVARGVNFTAMRGERGTTLCHHVAANITREDDLRFLVNVCGNDAVHAVDNHGETPLHSASLSGNELAMRVLVELGAEIDRQRNGWTALINVSRYGDQSSSVELLIALGADVNLVASNGRTACHIAAAWKNPAALCALVAAGGDLDQPNKYGETSRMIATRNNVALPTADEIDAARRRIAKARLDLVRQRAFQICVGLQSFRLDALQLCEILMHSFDALGSLILFHQWWAIATKVKHFHDNNK
jgi:ankyrin repeat protein